MNSKARYLLDTNVLLHLVNGAQGHENIRIRLESLEPDQLIVSAVTVWEIYRMAEKAKVSRKSIQAALAMLTLLQVEPFDADQAATGGAIHAVLSNKGLTIGERDSMIAAAALVKKCTMVTDNTKEFCRIAGLVVENWRVA